MQTLSLALKNRGKEGEPLPVVFRQLDTMGLKFRRGWLHLIAGAPGGGKSALATYMAFKMDYTGFGDRVPTLYFSADNDKLTFGCAAVATALNIHTNEAEKRLEDDDDTEVYEVLNDATDHLWVNFDSGPSPRDITEEINAFASVYGDWPHFVVIDNLMDVDGSGGGFEDERTTQDGVLEFLKRKAREIGAAIVVLVHVTGQHRGDQPIPSDATMNKVDKRPQIVITLFEPRQNCLGASIVKHRRGRKRKDGTYYAEIPWMPEFAWFDDGRGNGRRPEAHSRGD